MYPPSESLRSLPFEERTHSILSTQRIARAGFLLLVFAFWMLQHPYEGLVHDSILYAFGALARLHPDSLAHDIYLSVGVQDRFTAFSPLAARVVRLTGLERGAMLITLAAQLGFFGCGWLIARRLLTPTAALLSLALLVVLPPQYGDGHIFSYAETFMTARLPSEVFVLAALTATLYGRYILGGAFLLGSALLHPIIAAGGLAVLSILVFGFSRPRLIIATAAIGFATVVTIAWVAPFGPLARFDKGWFDLLYTRGAYLFPTRWAIGDWAHASVPLASLAAGATVAKESRVRLLCIAALTAGLAGLLISLLGADLLHIVLIAQAQPWRWLWLSNALAVVLLPAVIDSSWNAGEARRAALILLAAAWVCIDEPIAPVIGVLAILAAAYGGRVTDSRQGRLMLLGSWTVLGLALLGFAAYVLRVTKQIEVIPPDRTLYDSPYLLALRHWKSWEAGGVLPACVLIVAWLAMIRRLEPAQSLAILACGAALCAAFAHFAWNAWTEVASSSRLVGEFAPWRQVIPETSQVLWLQDAFPVWYLLERPSYWSRSQTSASVYSENMARELARREWVLHAVQESTNDPRQLLIRTCVNSPALGYYVMATDAGPSPFPIIKNPKGAGDLRLYRCADYRR